ncbi:MAG: hypothetical protein AB1938_32560 [Myxococcota bacterium]
MWDNFFRDGGFGMWPTVLFGFFLVASSGLFALRPERRFLMLAAALGASTFGSGILGASVGLINTMRAAQGSPAEERLQVAFIGTAESLNNIVLALILFVLASLLVVAGAARTARNPAAA